MHSTGGSAGASSWAFGAVPAVLSLFRARAGKLTASIPHGWAAWRPADRWHAASVVLGRSVQVDDPQQHHRIMALHNQQIDARPAVR